MAKQMQPQDVSDIELAFPASVKHLMPDWATIPAEYKKGQTVWNRLQSDWFYLGIKDFELKPKEGIDAKRAIRHIKAIQGSYEPKHEHKAAAVAYLLSLWFEGEPKWTSNDNP